MRETLEVRLYGERVGTLTQLDTTLLGFEYDDRYAERPDAAPLSTCLPLKKRNHKPKRVTAWFEGLLPEGTRREHLARIVGTASIDTWSLLNAAGGECAGAVQLVNPAYRDEPGHIALSEAALAKLLFHLPVDVIGQVSEKARISIAGAQDKVVLRREANNRWSVPVGGAPSTHLLKPRSRNYPMLVENEHWCMTVAREAGVETASMEITNIGYENVLVIERYDRRDKATGGIERIHQEDTAQALGRGKKYQDDGGPALHEIAAVQGIDPKALLERTVLAWILGNGDAHAKNYSVLEPGTSNARLAPVYDMVCTECYIADDTFAMKIGRAQRGAQLTAHDIAAASARMGIGAGESSQVLRSLGGRVLNAMDRAQDSGVSPGPIDTKEVKTRAQWAANGLAEAKRPKRSDQNKHKRPKRPNHGGIGD